ncbi:hypothetical protein [Ruegeria hyattellae]
MQTLQHSYRGLSLLFELNWDRLLFVGALGAGLAMGAYLNSF